METRSLGRTGIQTTILGLGGLFVSRVGGDRDAGVRAVRRALELGVNYVDTAPTYADSEEVLGIALDGVSQPYVLATKLGGRPTPFDPKDKDLLRRSLDESLRLLRRDSVDILMVHEPDRPGHYDWWTNRNSVEGPVNHLLDELQDEGLIRFKGIGGTTAYDLAHIIASGRYDVVLTAFNYTLLWREALISIIPEAQRQGMGVIVGSPLQQGALARRYDDEVNHGARWLSPPRRVQYKALYALLDDTGIPLPELCLRSLAENPDISTILTGARSVEEVEQNIRSVEAEPLPIDVTQRLDEIAAMLPYRPSEEPFSMPFGRDYRGLGPLS